MGQIMDPEQLKIRAKEFTKKIIFLCRQLPGTQEGRSIGGQLFRSGTSVGANYRATSAKEGEGGQREEISP